MAIKLHTPHVRITKRIRQAVILIVAIFIGLLVTTVSVEAKNDHRFGKKSIQEARKQNKRYAHACELLKAKRNAKEKTKEKTVKWR